MGGRKRSASRNKAATRVVKRATVEGGRGRARQSRLPDMVGLFRRLRRLELAVAFVVTMKPKDFDLDSFVQSVLQLKTDAALQESRGSDEGSAVPVPHQGTPVGEAARAPGVDWGPEGGEGALSRKPSTSQKEE